MPIIIFILTLTLLVVLHELGHFLLAKLFKVSVLEFGFGIPPRIWGKKIGETLVSLNWLPIGGFVRLLGEDDDDPKMLLDKRSFVAQNVSKRIAIVVMGVVMNFLLSWVLFYIVIIAGNFSVLVPTPQPVVAVDEVVPSSPASLAGLKPGDIITSVNNQSVASEEDLLKDIQANLGKKVTLGVTESLGGEVRDVTLTPRSNPPKGQGPVGIAMTPFLKTHFNTPLEKILSGPVYSIEVGKLIFQGAGTLVSQVFSGQFQQASSQVAGPVGVAKISTTILSSGWDAVIPYIWFSGYLSLTLAIMNVLPIPALDGGRLFFLLIEAVVRKRVHATTERYVHAVGMVVLIALIVLITISDIRKYIF